MAVVIMVFLIKMDKMQCLTKLLMNIRVNLLKEKTLFTLKSECPLKGL